MPRRSRRSPTPSNSSRSTSSSDRPWPFRSLDDLGDRLGIVLKDPEAIHQAFVHSSYFNENPHRRRGAQRAPRVPRRCRHRPDRQPAAVRALPRRGRGTPHRAPGRARQPRCARLAGPFRSAWTDTSCSAGESRRPVAPPVHRSWPAPSRRSPARSSCPRASTSAANGCGACSTRPLPGADEAEPPKSAKSRLQEWSQREHRIKPHYELVSTTGPDHDQTFTVAAVLRGERIAIGRGSSRQRAEEQAASAALDSMGAPGIEV